MLQALAELLDALAKFLSDRWGLELAEKYSGGLREMLADNKGDLAVTREDARDRLTSAESEIESSSLKR
jgi:hypothetical protein